VRDHTVELSDRAGHVLRVAISTVRTLGQIRDAFAGDFQTAKVSMTGIPNGLTRTFINQTPGYWRVINYGLIRYNSGKVFARNSGADATTLDIYLANLDGTWGMQLWEYEDALGVNGQGTGSVTQPWVVGLSPGKFSWVLID
jgi:hypothetical protein